MSDKWLNEFLAMKAFGNEKLNDIYIRQTI